MTTPKRSTFLLTLVLLLYANTLAQNSEKPVKMKDLPAAVQATVKQQSKGATIRGLSKEVEKGKTFYEVELKVSGHKKDVMIGPTGAVVTIEEEIRLASLPSAARAEIEKQAANGKIRMIESITENDRIVAYEAHIKIGKRTLEVKVAPDGELIATESDEGNEDGERTGGKKASQETRKP